MIITIDGPAGSGKSAAALALAKRLQVPQLDTGAMYRAVALDALEIGILHDPDAMAARVRRITLTFDWTRSPAPILLNGRDVSDLIRQPQITEVTYLAADNPWVREELVRQQRAIGQAAERHGGLVTEGRDQGSIVFPTAEFKFYLDADPHERARRRIEQLKTKGITVDANEVLQQIVERDTRDQNRAIGGLSRPKDAIVVDTSDLTLDQVVDNLFNLVRSRSLF